MLKFTVKEGSVLRERVDAILVGVYEDAREKGPLAAEVNRLLGGAVDRVMSRKSFLGKAEKAGFEQIRQAMGRAVLRAREMGLKRVGVSTNSFIYESENIAAGDAAAAMAEGANLALYKFTKYKVKENGNSKYLEEIRFVEEEKKTAAAVKKGVEKGRIISDSVNVARDLINHPANDMTPTIMAESAKKMAKAAGIKCTV